MQLMRRVKQETRNKFWITRGFKDSRLSIIENGWKLLTK